MYVGIIMGKEIRLTNRQYKSLAKRWSPDNLGVGIASDWKVMGRCILCKDTGDDDAGCDDCPLFVFEVDGLQGCMRIIKETIGKYGYASMRVSYSSNIYFPVGGKTAKKYMQKMQDLLNTFKREKSGGNESSG